MFLAIVAAAILFDSNQAQQPLTCNPNSQSQYSTMITKANQAIPTCKRDICFGALNSAASLDLTSNEAQTVQSLACGYNPDQLKAADCSGMADVAGYTCPLCTCTSVDSVKWHEQVNQGRTCRLYRCANLTNSLNNGRNYVINCDSARKMAYLPQTSTAFNPQAPATGTQQGIYLPSVTAPNDKPPNNLRFTSSYTEFNTANYSCPMPSTQICAKLADNAALPANVLGYARGTYYTGRSNTNDTCYIDYCNGQDTWTVTRFTTNDEITSSPSQLNLVKQLCPNSTYLKFSRCYNKNGKMYFRYSSQTACRISFCDLFYCECPPANQNISWYVRHEQVLSVTSNTYSLPVPNVYKSGRLFWCQQYSCAPIRINANNPNFYRQLTPNRWDSYYGVVSPCDSTLGHSAKVGEYYRFNTALSAALTKLPMERRSPAILNIQSANDPLTAFSSTSSLFRKISYQTAISNATCNMLGTADCFEVKPYEISVQQQRTCPEVGRTAQNIQNCPSSSTNCVYSVKGRGQFVDTRIQCFANRENFVMKPLCKKHSNMQSAYENFDRCINNANYRLNIRPKIVNTQRCSISNFYTRWLKEGKCDHSVIREFLTHTAGCYCKFVNEMSKADTPEMKQSAQAMFDYLLNFGASYANELRTIFNQISSYGCTAAPFRCSSGSVTYSIRRPTMSGRFTVKTSCKNTDVYQVRSSIGSFLTDSGLVTQGYKSSSLRVTQLSNGTNQCIVHFSAFVKNPEWAGYLHRNTTQRRKPLNGKLNTVYESITLDGVGSAVSASPIFVTVPTFVLLSFAALFV